MITKCIPQYSIVLLFYVYVSHFYTISFPNQTRSNQALAIFQPLYLEYSYYVAVKRLK